MPLRLVLIRHAAVDTGGRLCGSLDVPLAPQGRREVARLVSRPPRHPAPDALFTSTLARAREVAAALGRMWRLDPHPAEWAREIHCGRAEGRRLAHLEREEPALWARHQAQGDDTLAWPGGESYAAFRARVRDGFEALAVRFPRGRVAVVTHAGVVSQVLGLLRGRRAAVWAEDRPAPLTATIVDWTNGGPRQVISYSESDWY